MASKIPSRLRKDKVHNSRPYDRPNQGIIRRVASTVKSLLTPSWLWGKAVSEENNVTPPPVSENLTENEDDTISSLVEPKPMLSLRKRPRFDCDVDVASTSKSDEWLSPSTSKPVKWLSPSTSKQQLVDVDDDNVDLTASCDMEKKDVNVMNGDDYSENSDGSASTSGCSSLISSHQDRLNRSTGLRLSESALEHLRSEFKNKPAFQQSRKDVGVTANMFPNRSLNSTQPNVSLWSCNQEARVKSSPKPRPIIQNNKPSFSISSFGGPSVGNISESKKLLSPFYEGNTTFGGASAYRKKPIISAPYEVNSEKMLRNKIKIKENKAANDFECMSSAAKRILHTLEKMSTPITDAKRIPSASINRSPVDISVVLTPPSRRYSYSSSFSKKTSSSSKGPPIVNLNTVSKLTVLKNNSSKISRNTHMEIPIQRQSLPLNKHHLNENNVQDIGAQKVNGGGKIKNKLNQQHSSTKAKEEKKVHEEYSLPNIPLPIKNLPSISFGNNHSGTPGNGSSSFAVGVKHTSSVNEQMPFTFASPIEYIPLENDLQSQSNFDDGFKFSSPLVMKEKNAKSSDQTKNTCKRKYNEKSETVAYESVDNVLKRMTENGKQVPSPKISEDSNASSLHNNSPKLKNKAMKTNGAVEFGNQKTSHFTSSSSLMEMFKPEPGSWECPSCMVRNKSTDVKCVACETSQPSNKKDSTCINKKETSVPMTNSCAVTVSPSTPNFSTSSSLVSHTSNFWECDACLVKNPHDKAKCLACETLRPSEDSKPGFGEKFKLLPGSWECSSCLVRNDEHMLRCISCETPKNSCSTGTSKTSENKTSFGDKFKPDPGSWECSSCLVRNKANEIKCVACETPNSNAKQDKNEEASTKKNNGSITSNSSVKVSFSSNSLPVQTSNIWDCDSCMAKNPLDKQNCIACSAPRTSKENAVGATSGTGFTFGKPTVQGSVGGFKFGTFTSAAAPVTTTTTPSFKFGASADVTTTSSSSLTTPTFKSAALPDSVKKSDPSPVSFGITSEPSTTTTAFKLEVPSSGFKFGTVVSSASAEANNIKPLPTAQTVTTSVTFGSINSAPTFSFNTNSENTFSQAANSQVTTASSTAEFKHDSLRTQTASMPVSTTTTSAPSTFMFGSTTSAPSSVNTPFFKFNSVSTNVTPASGNETLPKSSTVFKFGTAAASSDVKPSQAGFAFKVGTEDNSMTGQAAFKPFNQESTNPVIPTSSAPPAPFKFGCMNTTPVSSSSGGFVFGVSKVDTSQTTSIPFAFGSGMKPSDKPGFGSFSQNQALTTASIPTFSFGTNLATTAATTVASVFKPSENTGIFTFGNKSTPIAPNSINPGTATTPVFGCPPAQPVFGNSTPTFGTVPEQKPPAPGGFTFGAPASASPAPIFQFGATTNEKPAVNPQPGFNFNVTPQAESNPSFSSNFNINTPPSFNFGATSTPNSNQPFQFAASAESSSSNTNTAPRRIRKAIRRGLRKPD